MRAARALIVGLATMALIWVALFASPKPVMDLVLYLLGGAALGRIIGIFAVWVTRERA